jgi:SAM-dependent methyltransferase
MTNPQSYAIRGGIEGRERLRILSRVMHESSSSLLDRLELRDGLRCLDAGCGGGDITLALAQRVGPTGKATGIDRDEAKLAIARQEAHEQCIANVEYLTADIREACAQREFDVVYARFLLTHLRNPKEVVSSFYECLRRNGKLAVEDIDFSGHFTYPSSPAFDRYHELYCTVVRRNGGDPDIGPRLPGLVKECGFDDIHVNIVQPMALAGEAKLITPITLENIAPSILEQELATREEIEELTLQLYDLAEDEMTLAGLPRVVQVWAQRKDY